MIRENEIKFVLTEFSRQSKLIFENGQTKTDDQSTSIQNTVGKQPLGGLTKKKHIDNLEILSHQVNYR